MLEKRPYPVDLIVTHYEPHEDELLLREMALRFGKEAFPRIRNSRVDQMDAGLHPETGRDGDYYLVKHRTLCDGLCGGEFDEHDKKPSERKMQSAAARMASWLNIQNDPALKKLLDFSLRSDRHTGNSSFELPNLIKAWNNAGFKLDNILWMYHTIFKSLYQKFSGKRPVANPAEGEFRRLIAEWFATNFGDHDGRNLCLWHGLDTGQKAAELFGQINNEDTWPIVSLDMRDGAIGEKTDFDLESILEAMVQAGIPKEERNSIVISSLAAKYAEQCGFGRACLEFREKIRFLQRDLSVYKIGVITSDSRHMNRAARFEDGEIDVLIQFCPERHVRIFDLRKRLDMDYVARHLRINERDELVRMGRLPRKYISDSDLFSEGTLLYIQQWFNWREGHGVFCGTNTAPHMPFTCLSRGQITACVVNGVNDAYNMHHTIPQKQYREWIVQRKNKQKKVQLQRTAECKEAV